MRLFPRPFYLLIFAATTMHLVAPSIGASSSGPETEGLQVYWYEDIGPHQTLDTIDWSESGRLSRAYQVNWAGTAAPWEPGAASDMFAVRIVGSIRAHTDGEYRFRLDSDDGSRLFINDEMVIDNDATHSMRRREGVVTLDAGYHPVEIFYFERYGTAGLILEWQPPGASSWVVVPQPAFADLDATIEVDWYFEDHAIVRFDDVEWTTPDLSTTETQINWPDRTGTGFLDGSPDERFALRARSRLVVPESGIYRFELGSDDGSRLRIGNRTVIERDTLQSFRWDDGEIYLAQGLHDMEVIYFENTGWAGLVLMWQGPSDPSMTVVPHDAYRSPAGTARPRIVGWSEQPRLEAERDDWP
jgi:hypothetical protein